ncbi:ABC transporter substrate-binding protein [Anaerocolumna sp. MB42-C2]|uniref:ABC transporter substrate-binding protein n=1 Tax=Anaerocolumna sp. MB42-C2 TaxID=3070997 RepID=UPI0027E10E5A|nr:ABC transporter substrate-binding protein [Anaerocolumna sp. MB42-C2]WMJ86570.1 ABC transporter substrate-binding protein [Anaerocolumna sp. MB42-C2]
MRVWKKLLALGLATTMLLSLTACSSKGTVEEPKGNTSTGNKAETSGDTSAADDKKQDITISIMASQDWVQDAELELGKKFTEKTGIKIDYQIVPSDQYNSLHMTKLNTGECTDIFAGQSGKFDIQTQYNVEKNAVDLSGEGWAKNVDTLAAAELTVNNALYGQPIQDVSSVWAVAYNKQIFSDLGLTIPTNYEEFKKVCDAILAAGKTPIYECVSDGWHHVLWFPETAVQAEVKTPGLVDKLNKNETTFAQDDTLKLILTQIKDMVDKGYWGDNYMSNTYADAGKNIASGEYVMTIANQGFGTEVNKVDQSFSADNIGYFVMPLADNQTLNVNPSGPSRFIYSGSKNIEAAKQYLDYMASDESLAYLTENVSKFNKLPYSNAPSKYTDTIKSFYDTYTSQGTVFQTAVKYVNPQWMDIGSSISALLLGEATPEEVLKLIDKNRSDQAITAKDPAWAK